jgi:hypothetical protein
MMNEESIKEAWESYLRLVSKIGGDRGAAAVVMVESLEDRLPFCPAEPRTDSPGHYPGGLIEQALVVTKGMKKMNDGFTFDVPTETILIVGLFHEIGKVGSINPPEPYFIDEDSSWHREKLGAFYKHNDRLAKLSVPERSLLMLQHFGVQLTEDEWTAIRGPARQPEWAESRLMPTWEPKVATLLRTTRDILVRKLPTK